MTSAATEQLARPVADPRLVRRINQLFHELTQSGFDELHRCRHRAERPFWRRVAGSVLVPAATMSSSQDRGLTRTIVDLACGTGFVSRELAPYLRPCDQVIAVDLSLAALRAADSHWTHLNATRPSPRFTPLVASGETLPLPDGQADLIAMNAALHHVPDPAAALREMDRVLKPGGRIALGFEPNRVHFASPLISDLSSGVTRLAWYASPAQNGRRLRRWLGRAQTVHNPDVAPYENLDVLAARMNDELAREGLIRFPLSADQILDHVDPHARGSGEHTGFDPAELLGRVLPHYRIEQLTTCDYLGEAARRAPAVRQLIDAAFRAVLPRHGSLFSWLIRKPDSSRQERTK